MDLSSIALQGIAQAEVQLEAAATNLASAGAATPDGANLDVVDISKEMVALMSAKTLFALNISTLKTADQIQKSVIDLTA
jgi:flagellar hook protein FlgE